MAEAVGRESETAESSTPESDGPGGPDTQQEDDYLGDNELVQVAKLRHKLAQRTEFLRVQPISRPNVTPAREQPPDADVTDIARRIGAVMRAAPRQRSGR